MIKPGLQVILFLALRSIQRHAFSSFLAIFSISMAGGLVLSTWKINQETRRAFHISTSGFDAVLGARGSKLQIILNSLFHLEDSPGNLTWEQYELIKSNRGVKEAYPIAVGDNFLGYRLVGTEPDLFEKHEWNPGRSYEIQSGGRIFSSMAKEALVGSFVADQIGLKLGDQFHPYHGLDFNEENKHEDIYVVVGILEPTGTPTDRVIWIPIKGIQLMEGHDPAMAHSLSAVLLKLKGSAGFSLHTKYNKQGNVATLAWPIASTLSSFFDKFSWFQKVLELVAGLVAIIGVFIIILSLRTSMNEKKREFAILRCLGASRKVVTSIVLFQSLTLAFLGGVGGVAFHYLINLISFSLIRENTGVMMNSFSFDPMIFYLFGSVLVLGLISGILPSFQAYKNELSENLKIST
jgi:putative ABC transport system permease protein